MKSILSLIIFLSAWGNNGPHDSTINVLFVGNSLTFANGLPALVEAYARDHGVILKAEVLALPNYALEDHWNDGDLQKRIATRKFRYVVVQQGPSSQADGREMLLNYGSRIKKLCEQHRSKLAFYMVWPARANFSTFDGVVANYSEAAKVTGALLCPVGQVWRDHFKATQDYSYYGPDGFHPSPQGSAVAARVIYESLAIPRE